MEKINAPSFDTSYYPDQGKGIVSLEAIQYRNYERLRLNLYPQPVVLTGPNGAGKTNLLEAISLFSPGVSQGRSLRNAPLSDLRRQGSSGAWGVNLQVAMGDTVVDLGTGMVPSLEEGEEKRLLRIDGKTTRRQADLSEYLSMVWLTPAMDGLLVESPEARRRFLDRLAAPLDDHHLQRLQRYAYSLRQRSFLLKTAPYEKNWISSLEEIMAREGVGITITRWQTLEMLKNSMAQGLGLFPQADLSLEGWIEGTVQRFPALESEDLLREKLEAGRGADGESGGAGEGPHRGDLLVSHHSKKLKASQCSTGEQKALLVSIILGFARIQRIRQQGVCILLLDDIVAHLDHERRLYLFDEVGHLSLQAWMTGTDMSCFEGLGDRAQFFKVAHGEVYESF
jgi:DNA replication and repair protein RecF